MIVILLLGVMKILEFLCSSKHFGAVPSSQEAGHHVLKKVLASIGFCFNVFSGPVSFPIWYFPQAFKDRNEIVLPF